MKLNKINKDNRGNIYIGIASVLIISFLILSICVLNLAIHNSQENLEDMSSDEFNYIIQDYKRNIAIVEKEAIKEVSEEVIDKKRPVSDSKEEIKKKCDEKLEELNEKYYNQYHIRIVSSINSIENVSEPFDIRFKTYISSVMGDMNYKNIEENDINIEGLMDPIPFIYCGNGHGFSHNDTCVIYGESLSDYLKDKGVDGYEYYINATAPLIIRKCPYDPYKHHGDGFTMKTCRDSGYYHESADGACYLCRLEGKSGCGHYGFETFINPQPTTLLNLTSACGSDHVIFGDDTYPGIECIYYSHDGINEILFLDPNGHRVKYGMDRLI
ncbi:MAG: hypothetical protein Q4P14_03395 [Methanobacteriaceae archaeon]|nr:hypothetical protein [Methanobacteriaceae archaeon]